MREIYCTKRGITLTTKWMKETIQILSTEVNGLLKRPLKSLCVLSEYNVMFVTHVGCMPVFVSRVCHADSTLVFHSCVLTHTAHFVHTFEAYI